MTHKPGDQIAYVPIHAQGDIDHKDVEYGFVSSDKGDYVFCRYWRNGQNGLALRTTANSEATPRDCLVAHTSATNGEVARAAAGVGIELAAEKE